MAYVLLDVSSDTDLSYVEAMTPMPLQYPVLAASAGKSFVVVTIRALESQGMLYCVEFMSRYVGDWPWFDKLPVYVSITICDVLRHMSDPAFDQPLLFKLGPDSPIRILSICCSDSSIEDVTGRDADTQHLARKPWSLSNGRCLKRTCAAVLNHERYMKVTERVSEADIEL